MRNLLAVVLVVTVVGCSGLEEEEAGVLDIPLTTMTSGDTYRLAGTLEITGPNGSQTVDLGAVDTYTTELPPGDYSLRLSNWTLQKNGSPLEAELISPNPQRFTITPRSNTRVTFRFVTGRLTVDFDVNGRAYWFSGELFYPTATDQMSAPPGPFAPYFGRRIRLNILFDNVTKVSDYGGGTALAGSVYEAIGVHFMFSVDPDPSGYLPMGFANAVDNQNLSMSLIRDDALGYIRLEVTTTAPGNAAFSLMAPQLTVPVDGNGIPQLTRFTAGTTLDPSVDYVLLEGNDVMVSPGTVGFDFVGPSP